MGFFKRRYLSLPDTEFFTRLKNLHFIAILFPSEASQRNDRPAAEPNGIFQGQVVTGLTASPLCFPPKEKHYKSCQRPCGPNQLSSPGPAQTYTH